MSEKPKSAATRDGYGEALVEIGGDERIVVIDADLSECTRSKKFREKYPERFINVGVAEQNLMGISAGLAATGKIPFASTFAIFVMRGYEQIRNSICYSELNVKICGSHGGLATGEDGATHQCLEDFSLMRAIPNMVVLSPADITEAKKCVIAAYKHKGPVYIRTTRAKTPVLFDENYKFKIGKGVIVREGEDISLIATGPMVSECIKAAESLEKQGISAKVVNMSTIKPIDEKLILRCADTAGAIITCEDHLITGGLGSAVAEVLAEHNSNAQKGTDHRQSQTGGMLASLGSVPLECQSFQFQPNASRHQSQTGWKTLCILFSRIGVRDSFGESGTPDELWKKYGIDAESIAERAKNLLNMKNKR